MDALDVDDVIAHLLVTEGFSTVEDVADAAVEDLAGVEGFDEEIATELQRRAREYHRQARRRARRPASKSSASTRMCAAIEGLTPAMLVALGEKGVKTLRRSRRSRLRRAARDRGRERDG